MSWKSLLSAGFAVCVLSSSVVAAPTVKVTNPALTANAQGNRVWTVQIIPDGGASLPSALAVELPFTHTPGLSVLSMGIVDNAANQTNTAAANNGNDTWYYNETSGGSGTILWNISDPPSVADVTQNPGANPFTAGTTSGLYVASPNVFASLGSTIIAAATPSVNVLQIVTQGRGGILHMGAGVIAQAGTQFVIPAQDFYVPGDFDGDGRVGNPDFNLLSFNFNKPKPVDWDGYQPVNPAQIGNPEFNALSFNFGAGQSSGAGSGGSVPEPTSALLVLSAAVLSGLVRRRRG
jgi:hypothetical protein